MWGCLEILLELQKYFFQGTGFISHVQFGDKTVSSKVPCSNKKQAQQLAAREALLAIGVSNPEDAFNNKESRKLKSKRTMPQMSGFKRTWVHSRGDRGQLNPWYTLNFLYLVMIG